MFLKATLLLGLAVLGIHVWAIEMEFVDISKDLEYFAVSVEFAVAWFNSGNTEEQAYKLLEQSWTMIYLMELDLGRTVCKKHDEDIDKCPLQESPGERKKYSLTYLMDLDLGRTICKKHDEDIDNCPLQEGPEGKKLSLSSKAVNVDH
ncbi:hypothetical protein MJG53_011679 [Ovis ammon polii x Ovis aries]|uniref:Cystatin domain-containing protein n=3 Tax=Ovis TaxID=9935 RepID=A0A835ZY31_SHEEP|nr:hypothetical protein JEQ12_004280 [Ovis aries]KAI4538140.1 hypothetical protein MG293_011543 [Ovis ammon polii]KAI4562349.1 hypothetical protein MJT46_011311 [Ovis ammon polii x Ovis aries]KAI4575476.1 hypothetical protein MJG53_011679 [Ovis ammon polii x Ovis aries]